MSRKQRAAALVAALVFVAFAVLSLMFLVMEAGHDCAGDECPVCEQMAALSAVVRGAAVLLVIWIALSAVRAARRAAVYHKTEYPCVTPVTLKTKLSN